MATRTKFCYTLFLLSFLVLCACLAMANKDPELKQCRHQCKVQRQYDEEQKEQCLKDCKEYYREKKARERQREGESEEDWGGRHRGDDDADDDDDDPEKRLSWCQKQCERQEGGQQRQLCRFRCQERYKKEKEGRREHNYRREEEQEEEQDQEEENPYVFEDSHFTTRVKTEHGRVVVLPKFTEKSKLLRGLEKYRLAILIAKPQAFVVPNHLDADGLFFVSWGRGTIAKIHENKRESINVRRGDIVRIRAGTPFYIVNSDENEKLYIVKLLRPVNIPGHYEAFHGPGGENPESFFRAFSWEILEAALKTPRDRLERLFEKQDQGSIMRASREQIRALSRSEEGPSIWPFAGESRGSFNLFKKTPSQSNNYGQLFETEPQDYGPLEDFNVRVSYANITGGGMAAPFYNSESTKIAVVVSGEGHIEIACPHLSSRSSRQEKSGPRYKRVSSRIRTDSVYIVPAGHPVATVASGNQNLEILCFEVNAKGNTRYFLAGRKNIMKLMEREAKELAFKTKGEEVDRVFGKQTEEFFFQGPRWQQEEGRSDE